MRRTLRQRWVQRGAKGRYWAYKRRPLCSTQRASDTQPLAHTHTHMPAHTLSALDDVLYLNLVLGFSPSSSSATSLPSLLSSPDVFIFAFVCARRLRLRLSLCKRIKYENYALAMPYTHIHTHTESELIIIIIIMTIMMMMMIITMWAASWISRLA